MARKKVKLAWIPNDAARRATFKKRRKGILKKISELSTLCGVPACAIIYGPHEAAPEVWPSLDEAAAVLERFRSMPETEQTKKMMNQERFLKDRIVKTEAQIARAEKENNEAECAALMFRCIAGGPPSVQNLDIGTVMSLAWMVEMKMKAVRERIEGLEAKAEASSSSAAAAPPPALPPEAFPTPGEELGALEAGLEAMRRPAAMFGDYNNPQVFWPAGDPTGAVGFVPPPPILGDGSTGGGYLQFPGIDGSSSSSNINNMNMNINGGCNSGGGNPGGILNFNNPSWLEHYFHNGA